ncbi:transposase [Pseudarthrobacter sp. PS3-L1]|uniref:transposase n=1 Tax=Pseudarthrobacter sp. PS3-L1 TaxID=3046207 RepID=UPI0024B886B7|nr:transposase [Pseudarthrobacter sp. PS3-L1]MDJ0318960.1 transposase [Pseudarthrobacter sp. PS3-L1]
MRKANAVVHAQLLDLVLGRSGKAYAHWLKNQAVGFADWIGTAVLDPFRGQANAIRDELPETITVLDVFHVLKLGSIVMIRPAVAFRKARGPAWIRQGPAQRNTAEPAHRDTTPRAETDRKAEHEARRRRSKP